MFLAVSPPRHVFSSSSRPTHKHTRTGKLSLFAIIRNFDLMETTNNGIAGLPARAAAALCCLRVVVVVLRVGIFLVITFYLLTYQLIPSLRKQLH
jgi:hypothetical protein